MNSNAVRRGPLPDLKNARSIHDLRDRVVRREPAVIQFRNNPEKIIRLIFAILPTCPGLPLEGPTSGLIQNLHRARTPRTANEETVKPARAPSEPKGMGSYGHSLWTKRGIPRERP